MSDNVFAAQVKLRWITALHILIEDGGLIRGIDITMNDHGNVTRYGQLKFVYPPGSLPAESSTPQKEA